MLTFAITMMTSPQQQRTDEDGPTKGSWPSDAEVKVLAARNTGAGGARLEINTTDRVEIAAGPGSMWSGLYQANGNVFATYSNSGTSYVVGPL